MSNEDPIGGAFSKLRDALEKVAAGVGQATLWTQFTQVVAPVIAAAPGQKMTGAEIEAALADETNHSPELTRARAGKADFVEAHGAEAWEECIRSSAALKVQTLGGKTTVTRISPGP